MSGDDYTWPPAGSTSGGLLATKAGSSGASTALTHTGSVNSSAASSSLALGTTAADCYLTAAEVLTSGATGFLGGGGDCVMVITAGSATAEARGPVRLTYNGSTLAGSCSGAVPIVPALRVPAGTAVTATVTLNACTNTTSFTANVQSVPYTNIEGH